jgi:hypothetical protein
VRFQHDHAADRRHRIEHRALSGGQRRRLAAASACGSALLPPRPMKAARLVSNSGAGTLPSLAVHRHQVQQPGRRLFLVRADGGAQDRAALRRISVCTNSFEKAGCGRRPPAAPSPLRCSW